MLKARDLTIGYPGTVLARGLNFEINKGERVVLIGPNGAGKSTLLKTITGLLPPLGGSIRQGSLVQIGYYEQEQQGLHRDKDVLHELWDQFPHMNELDIRKALGGFLFSGDDVNKSVAGLSGGEKSRLALAALMLRKANFLLLDEPTNHLDLPGKEALEDALADYPGTILFISHDRYFINKVASRALELSLGDVISYQGNYDYYLNKKTRLQGTAKSGPAKPERSADTGEKIQYYQKKEEERKKRKHQREIANLEQSIAHQEELISRLEKELEQPEVYHDYQACQQRQSELEQIRAVLHDHMEKWLNLIDTEQVRS
ncbi:MAG: putative ABC transporter ATP-binding protein [Pelotomaculum sp. PtaB.Bin013]|uniref:ATP-binding cassette domain-containing protein n=1 Tax=Pelotomaculum isophthalicicum JI TaxID=947010 RepID=A0A9X4H336_9FIRM|nr:ATP-binding cassette domain-containing protein [Pelotomaculum isophthalicicum]MDF9407728.1 ATP-binding cassette domain-containing protein [Pelotomaculum isophthalicicum JI]OPX83375.1 MAG: putative ABC transporter ATP-binding protein [Pelotomaculum sp. PtaB.Bin013]